jgi:predicted tellurium resistance membrane protein TerC
VQLATLSLLEIVLGIDNVVFIAILAGKLPANRQAAARRIGLFLAMFTRIALLCAIGWVMGLTGGLFSIPMFWTGEAGDIHDVTGRDLIMLIGGLFLIGKATYEIHDKLEGHEKTDGSTPVAASFAMVVAQLAYGGEWGPELVYRFERFLWVRDSSRGKSMPR